jgi:hypothetical protein
MKLVTFAVSTETQLILSDWIEMEYFNPLKIRKTLFACMSIVLINVPIGRLKFTDGPKLGETGLDTKLDLLLRMLHSNGHVGLLTDFYCSHNPKILTVVS